VKKLVFTVAKKKYILTTQEREILRQAGVIRGRLGGKARAEALTPERRREIAVKAIETRWRRHRAKTKNPVPNT
jgi:hypothetical protein